MARTVLALLVVLLIGGGAAGAYWKLVLEPGAGNGPRASARGPAGAAGVEVAAVRVGPAESTIDAVGTLVSNESVVLRPEVAGRVVAIDVAEGETVAGGTVLLELDRAVEAAELAQAEAQRDLARSNFERARELRRTTAGTQRALDEADAALRTAEAQVDLARARLAKRTLVAPFDARAGLRLVSPGEYLAEGTAIVNLEQIDPLKVDFRVPELFLPTVAPGQRIAVRIDAYPDEVFTGTVRAIDPQIDRTGRSLLVRAVLANADLRLRPGLFARVTLTVAERDAAMFIPEQAIVPQGDRQFVFRLVENGTSTSVARTEVTVGVRRGGEVEIRSGLEPTDRVVVAGLLKVRDGAEVTVVPPPDPAPPTAAAPARTG